MKRNRFAQYAWGILAYNFFVIQWGAFVRATGSGAGCGNHWPSCNGQAIPWEAQTQTLIEFTHRLTSGLALIGVIGLLVWAFRSYPKGHGVRLGATLSLLFIIIEALVGAGLVLFGWVANDTSSSRAIVVSIHLVNTLILLTVLALTAWWGSGGKPVQLREQGWLGWALAAGFFLLLILGASGAVTALGDTLFPVRQLAEGLQQDLSPTAHFLIRLRLYHPLLAVGVGLYLILAAGIFNVWRSTAATRRIARSVTILYLTQLALGMLNVLLLAPIWIQLIHLFLADLVVIAWVFFMAAAFASEQVSKISTEPSKTGLPSQKGVYGQPGH